MSFRIPALFLFLLQSAWIGTRAQPIEQIYRETPVDAHTWLKHQLIQGIEITGQINRIRNTFGDNSFSSLTLPRSLLLPWLELEMQASEQWESGQLELAIQTYQQALSGLLSIEAYTESVLCLYYIAEIESELEHFEASLATSAKALRYLRSPNQPFLTGLLFESRGFALWYLDDLAGSIRAFALAAQAWQSIQFQEGVVNAWNNLAALYEELRIPDRAEDCYQAALSNLPARSFYEQRGQLYANYAIFLYRTGRTAQARHYLELLRSETIWDVGLHLSAAEILEDADQIPPEDSLSPAQKIERLILLGNFAAREYKVEAAETLYSKGLEKALLGNHKLLARTAAIKLGKLLEGTGEFSEAMNVYGDQVSRNPPGVLSDQLFPYFRAVSPLFDGLIRCLIRLGQPNRALRHIHELVARQQHRTAQMIHNFTHAGSEADALQQLGHFASSYPEERILSQQNTHRSEPPEDCTVLEIWPDGNEVYLWIDNPKMKRFRQITTSASIRSLIDRVTDRLFENDHFLPRQPSTEAIGNLSSLLIHPIEDYLTTRRLLIIPHKEFEALPFELLKTSSGSTMLSQFVISYLPAAVKPAPTEGKGTPLVIVPRSQEGRRGSFLEADQLLEEIPDLEQVQNITGPFPRFADWIHVSCHLRLDDRFWITSAFEGGNQRLTVSEFVNKMPRTQLLSLAVCDSGNSRYPVSPFWLGYAGLFLTTATDAMVLNRWPLDELSSRIYLDFIRDVHQGIAMDEALRNAKIRFCQRDIERQGLSVAGDHPYFWAGITYIGWPGQKLRVERLTPRPGWLTPQAGGLLVGMIGLWLSFRLGLVGNRCPKE